MGGEYNILLDHFKKTTLPVSFNWYRLFILKVTVDILELQVCLVLWLVPLFGFFHSCCFPPCGLSGYIFFDSILISSVFKCISLYRLFTGGSRYWNIHM